MDKPNRQKIKPTVETTQYFLEFGINNDNTVGLFM